MFLYRQLAGWDSQDRSLCGFANLTESRSCNVGDIAEFLHEVPEALEDLVAWLREQPSIIDSLPGNLRDIFELKLDKVMDKEMELRLMKVNGWVN